MFGFNRLSIKSKLQIMLLVASLGSILVVGYMSWSKAKETLTERIFDQLTSVRASKASQVEGYFQILRHHVETLSEDRMVVSAMLEFNQEFEQLNQAFLPEDWEEEIEDYYTQEFFPRLTKNLMGTPTLETYRPETLASRYLQYYYIANNPNPVGQKDQLEQATDGSEYSRIHARYHAIFRNLIEKFGYYDLFLIDSETGNIVYSVYKETDYATSLNEGPYRNSSLAEVVEKVRENPNRGAVQMVDFQFYQPSYNAPAAFLASAIYDEGREVGILAVQLPVDKINNELTGNQNWSRDGLGETGEAYLVGSDLLMRSVARPLIEDPEAYLNELREGNIQPKTIEKIERLKTSILIQPVRTVPAQASISGKSGTEQAENYLGHSTLSSYSPVNIPGVNWGIIADIDLAEAYQPINELQFYLLATTIILVLIILFYAVIAAQQFVKPIETLIASSSKVKAGELDTEISFNTRDEFNELAEIFNSMVQQLRTTHHLLEEEKQENENLLLNVLPHSVIKRLRKGHQQISDRIQQVTLVDIQIKGLMKLTENKTVEAGAELFDELINTLDETAEKHQVQRLFMVSDRYLAACGLVKANLNHVNRSVEFALEALNSIKRFNQKHQMSFSLKIGIDTGAVMAAIVGKQKFRYQVWGEPVEITHQLQQNAEPNTIQVSQAVYDRLQELHSFSEGEAIVQDGRKLPTWVLGKTGLQDLISDLTLGLDLDDDLVDINSNSILEETETKEQSNGLQSLMDDLAVDIDTEDEAEKKEKSNGLQSLIDDLAVDIDTEDEGEKKDKSNGLQSLIDDLAIDLDSE